MEQLAKEGILGIICAAEAGVIWRLFTLLMKSKDDAAAEGKENTKILLEHIHGNTEATDKMIAFVQGRDRIGVNYVDKVNLGKHQP